MKVANITPGRELYLSIMQKVPRAVLAAYFDKYDDTRCDAETFSEFVMKRVHKMTRVDERLAPQEPTSSSKLTGQSVRPPVPPQTTHAINAAHSGGSNRALRPLWRPSPSREVP